MNFSSDEVKREKGCLVSLFLSWVTQTFIIINFGKIL